MIEFIVSLTVTGIAGMLCLFLCILNANKEELWEEIRGNDGRNS